jgi:hypothetical protein
MRWNIQSRYAAARIITNVAAVAIHGFASNAPTRVRNSPTNPDRPGRPTEANTKKPNTVA